MLSLKNVLRVVVAAILGGSMLVGMTACGGGSSAPAPKAKAAPADHGGDDL